MYEGDETGDSQERQQQCIPLSDNPTGWVNWKKDEALRVVPGVCGADGSVSQGASRARRGYAKTAFRCKRNGVSRFVLSRRECVDFRSFRRETVFWACSTAEKRMAMEQRGRNSFMSAAIFTWVLPDWRFRSFPGRKKVVSADGHRQRAGTVPKRGGVGGCAADRTLRSVCRYINRKIRLHYYESMETFLHDQPSQASGHERLFCGGVIQTGIIT